MATEDPNRPFILFKNNVIREIRNVMVNIEYEEDNTSTWRVNDQDVLTVSGSEMMFQQTKNNRLNEISVVMTAMLRPTPSAIVNMCIIKDNNRTLLNSFVVRESDLKTAILNGINKGLTCVGGGLTLPMILGINDIRDQLLRYLPPKSVCRTRVASRQSCCAMSDRTVDRTYWRAKLKKDFGADKVREATAKSQSFFNAYGEAVTAQKTRRRGISPAQMTIYPLRVEPRSIPPRPAPRPFIPNPLNPHPLRPNQNPLRPNPRHPDPFGPEQPDPFVPAPDPLNPLRDPRPRPMFPQQQPRFDPFGPDGHMPNPFRNPPQGQPRFFGGPQGGGGGNRFGPPGDFI